MNTHRRAPAIGEGWALAFVLWSTILAGTCHSAPSASAVAPGAGQRHESASNAGKKTGAETQMLQVIPSSRSLILRATHILVFQVTNVDATPWSPRPAGGEQRELVLKLRLEEIVKGRVAQIANSTVRLQVQQIKRGEGWTPMPGVWSNVAVDVGLRFVGFSVSGSRDAAVVLNDPAVVASLPAESALPEVHLAARNAQAHAAAFLADSRPRAGALGNLWADYLWARYGTEALDDVSIFTVIADALEWPELATVARSTLLMTIPDSVLAQEPPATKSIDRLAAAMVHILSLPSASALHENIVGTFLPNLVDAENPQSRSPASVFAHHPQELARLRQIAKAHAGDEEAKAFVAWANR
jgi:hypothetical protein